jgi:hypothetical protein
MQVLHGSAALSAVFDDPNLVSCAGLAPLVALAARAGLPELATHHVRMPGEQGANPGLKVPALLAGMVAGADSIADMDLLRHGGMRRLFSGIRAPSTLGIFLRAFTFGHVRQLDAVASRFLARLAGQAPILSGAERLVWLDVDDTVIQTYGYAKQAAARGYTARHGEQPVWSPKRSMSPAAVELAGWSLSAPTRPSTPAPWSPRPARPGPASVSARPSTHR